MPDRTEENTNGVEIPRVKKQEPQDCKKVGRLRGIKQLSKTEEIMCDLGNAEE